MYTIPPYSAAATSRERQFEELTAVQLIITEPPREDSLPTEFIYDQDVAPFQTFANAPALGARPKTEQKTMKLRDQLLADLHAGEVEIYFTTVKNEQRVMRCTLNESMIPEPARVTQSPAPVKIAPEQNQNLIKVYAIDRQGWRSFHLDRVSKIISKEN